MRRTTAAAVLAVAAITAGCGGGSASKAAARPAPDISAFLRLPVATPTACSGTVSGSTVGRRSPWVGRVDVSVFVESSASPAEVKMLGQTLTGLDGVRQVYFESPDEAFAEFSRLYTCSGDVNRSLIPASYRLVLAPMKRPARDALISRIRGLPAVKSVSCDPTSPCLPQ